jgi:hypothetical protein
VILNATPAKERIVPPLLADRRGGAVAGAEGDVVAERQEFFADRFDQHLVAAARPLSGRDLLGTSALPNQRRS